MLLEQDPARLFKSLCALPAETKMRIVAELNGSLACTEALSHAAKTAHRNVRGPTFEEMHERFGELYGFLDGAADTLAERVSQLGWLSESTLEGILCNSKLAPYPPGLVSAADHTRVLIDRMAQWRTHLRATRAMAQELGDKETSVILDNILVDGEKEGWKLIASTCCVDQFAVSPILASDRGQAQPQG